jgi:flagellar biosynthesis protein FlhF
LVGPTGVGKTTTVAKLAAGFRLQQQRRVGLLTIDTYRIAAVQQLQAYAEIMELPMAVVESPEQMQRGLDELGDAELVLIDTAGRSPRGAARLSQLQQMLAAAGPHETHLVVSATASVEAIRSALQGFAAVRPTATILTKLDETEQVAGVLAALPVSAPPLSYLTHGQQVPDDIATADAEALLARFFPSEPPAATTAA